MSIGKEKWWILGLQGTQVGKWIHDYKGHIYTKSK